MATMTATFIKPSTEPSSKGLYHHPTLTASKSSSLAYPSSGGSSSSSSNSRFPYLAYKSPEALYGDNSSKTAAAEAFLALHHHHQSATNLILRSSSLYDNSNYARTSAGGSVSPFSSKSSHSFAHPDFDASMLLAQQKQSPIKSTVIPIPSSNSSSNSSNASNQLPRVEVAKVSTTTTSVAKPKGSFSSASSSSSSEDGENYHRTANNHRSSSLVDHLTPEEHQALSRLLYKHFASSSAARAVTSTGTGNFAKVSLNESAPVPADYDEEDPRTWPSNWLAQVPTMILSPEVYLASKPLLNAYQRQLIRRLSAKYEPLVVHYLQQLVALRNSGGSEEVVRKLGGGVVGGDSFVGANILQSSSSSSRGSSGAKKQQQQPLLVKTSSHASALSQQQQQNAANNSGPSQHNHHQQMNNSFDLGNFACHSKEGTVADSGSSSSSRRSIINGTVDVLRSSPSLDSSALSSSSSNSSSMSSSRSNSSLSSTSSSPPPPPPTSQAPQKAPIQAAEVVGATRENRLARLSQQMANKWSNKMKIYLRKN